MKIIALLVDMEMCFDASIPLRFGQRTNRPDFGSFADAHLILSLVFFL